MIVTVTANPSVDRTYRIGTLRPGELHRADDVWAEASGKGVNVGRVLRRLGVPVRMIVTAGGGEGRLLAELLSVAGAELVPVRGATRVNITLLADGLEPTKINEPGTALSTSEADHLIAATAASLAGTRWLACCGSLPGGADPALVRRLITIARDAGVRVAVDASGAALAAAVDGRADLVKPNRDELAELVGRPIDTVTDAIAGGREIRARTGGTVLVSLGADGALLLTEAGGWHAASPPVTPLNSTGAGDALLAGYLADDTARPPARLAYAVSIGASACLAKATADLPDELVDPARVRVRPLHEDAIPGGHP
ncbi:hexose kinase [Actinomycetes bacterium KLBMP 9797]